jgi:DnaJ family protein C protein 11
MASAPPLQQQQYLRSPYAVLNLPQQQQSSAAVSDDRIRESYKRLSRLFHPDKHPPGKQRDTAQELFIELYYACESARCVF